MEVYKGLKINFIKVISTDVITIENKKYYKCKCDCGNEKLILKETIRTRRIRDCGCGEFARTRLIGKRFGKLLVIDANRNNTTSKKNIMCVCKCDCGNIRIIPASNLNSGKRISCGCVQKLDFDKYKNKTFDNITILEMTNLEKKLVKCKCSCGNIFETKLYNVIGKNHKIVSCGKCSNKYRKKTLNDRDRLLGVFSNMLDRCYNKDAKDYQWYGLKGIKICDDWLINKNLFIDWALNNGYKKGLTIDRINVNDDYKPTNCRWATIKQQQNNRSNNIKYLFNNKMLTLPEIADKVNINVRTLRSRLRKGMTFLDAISTPVRQRR